MARKAIELLTIEAASLRVHARDAFAGCLAQGQALNALGKSVTDALAEGYHDAGAEELLLATTKLRSAILHGLAVLNELQTQAAKLEEIAAIREAQVHQ